jgi:hypothetical protein
VIVLQKSKVEERQIFRENTKREAIADSYNLTRLTEVAYEFNVSDEVPHVFTRKPRLQPAEFSSPRGQHAWPQTLKNSRAWAYLAMKRSEDPIGALMSEFAALRFPDPTDPKRVDRRNEWAERHDRGHYPQA